MTEVYSFAIPADMAKPVHVYVEFENFYQNHRRWIRSVTAAKPNEIQRAGEEFKYHKELDGFGSYQAKDFRSAAYRYFHPDYVKDMRTGCYPWFAEGEDIKTCVEKRNEPCKKEPEVKDGKVQGNRVYYPCGLGARSKFHDT